MRPLLQLLVALFLLCIVNTMSAQDTEVAKSPLRSNSLSGHVLFIDHKSPMEDEKFGFDEITNGLEFAYHRYFNNFLGARIPFKAGLMRVPEESFDNKRTFVGLDATLEARLFKEGARIVPYAFAGIGGVMERDEDFYTQLPLGLGFNIKIGPWGFISAQAEYRMHLNDALQRNNIQYGLGLSFLIGKADPEAEELDELLTDSDGDGIPDVKDKCKDIPGVAAFRGCPDTDSDGIGDDLDKCPKVFGLKDLLGCPDSDGDGFADMDDACPDLAGTAAGCPDSDGDGVSDMDDKCPEVMGVSAKDGCPDIIDSDGDGVADAEDDCPTIAGAMNGCPDSDGDGYSDAKDPCPNKSGTIGGCPDSDGDGVVDNKDACPTISGSPSNGGCPAVSSEIRSVLNYAMQAVLFETGNAELLSESFPVLDQVAGIMVDNPYYQLKISGHTDDVGNDNTNLRLSEKRAKSCLEYLVTKGISKDRLSFIGYGEQKPIADNGSSEGRRTNRRVQFELLVEK